MTVSFSVNGTPAPQGSKVRTRYGMRESSNAVMPWREAVKAAIIVRDIPCTPGPVHVDVDFRFTRPKSHYGSGRNAHLVKDSVDRYPVGRNKGDLDKLLRSTFDALAQGGAITDDAYVVSALPTKRWCEPDELEGATITISSLGRQP